MKAIRAKVRRILEQRWKRKNDGPIEKSVLAEVWWWWIDLDKPNSSGLLMSAIDDRTEESGFWGYDALQLRRAKDPVRRERAVRKHQARNVTDFRVVTDESEKM